jgi:iron complex outermembrane receptor protein
MQIDKGMFPRAVAQRRALRVSAVSGASIAALISGLTLAGSAYAQTAPTSAAPSDAGAQEVVVTARARPEKLLSIPISVQAFSGAKLAQDNITNLDTLQASAGFTFNSSQASYGGGGRQYPDLTFRGLWSNVGGALGGSSGALFVDGVYISGGAASVTFADVSSVEVLKGPQNVYFGKNTFGGAVNLITSNPTEDYHAKASVGYSTKGSYDDTASVEGAIIPGLLTGRVTGELYHQGEQYKAYDGGKLGEQDTKGVTVVLYATPTPDVWLRSRFHYARDSDSSAAEGEVDGTTYGTNCPGVVNKYFCNGIPSLDSIHNPSSVLVGGNIDAAELTSIKTNNFFGTPERWGDKAPKVDNYGLERDNLQGSLSGGVNLPYDSTFQFTVGYNQAASDDAVKADHISFPIGTPPPAGSGLGPLFYFDSNVVSINRDFSGDARWVSSPNSPLRAVLGANVFRSVDQVSSGSSIFTNSLDKTWAVYGSLEYDIFSNLTLTGELRYQRDTVSDTQASVTYSKSYNTPLPRILLAYKPQKGTTLYASYSEGAQPPQLNGAYIHGQADLVSSGKAYLANALASYGGSSALTNIPKVLVYEVGWKQSLFDNRVTFSVDYYNQIWDNALVQTFIFDPSTCLTTYGQNYAENLNATCPLGHSGQSIIGLSKNKIQGVEFEAAARVTSKLSAHTSFDWTDAKRENYSELGTAAMFTSGVVPNENGLRVDEVPEYQWEGDVTYKDHLTGPYDWYVHGLATYTGSQYIDPTDTGLLNGYYRVNASAGIVRGNLTLEVYATNLLDDKNWDAAYRFPSSYFGYGYAHMAAIVTAPNPRNVGFRLSGKF